VFLRQYKHRRDKFAVTTEKNEYFYQNVTFAVTNEKNSISIIGEAYETSISTRMTLLP
jgi:hypothetical protein